MRRPANQQKAEVVHLLKAHLIMVNYFIDVLMIVVGCPCLHTCQVLPLNLKRRSLGLQDTASVLLGKGLFQQRVRQ